MKDLLQLQDRLRRLGEWHAGERDRLPWTGNLIERTAVRFHDAAASDCSKAVDMLGEYVRKLEG